MNKNDIYNLIMSNDSDVDFIKDDIKISFRRVFSNVSIGYVYVNYEHIFTFISCVEDLILLHGIRKDLNSFQKKFNLKIRDFSRGNAIRKLLTFSVAVGTLIAPYREKSTKATC